MKSSAGGPCRRLSWQMAACGAVALASACTLFGCHRKPSGGTQPSHNPAPAPSPATSGSVAQAVNDATQPYWSPAHVLVLPNSPDPVDREALNHLIEANGGKCGIREVAPGVYARLE